MKTTRSKVELPAAAPGLMQCPNASQCDCMNLDTGIEKIGLVWDMKCVGAWEDRGSIREQWRGKMLGVRRLNNVGRTVVMD